MDEENFKNKQRIGFVLSEQTVGELKKYARVRGMFNSAVVEFALTDYLKRGVATT